MKNITLLTVKEVAEMLRLSVIAVYLMAAKKKIPVVKLSAKCVRFKLKDIEKFINDKTIPAVEL